MAAQHVHGVDVAVVILRQIILVRVIEVVGFEEGLQHQLPVAVERDRPDPARRRLGEAPMRQLGVEFRADERVPIDRQTRLRRDEDDPVALLAVQLDQPKSALVRGAEARIAADAEQPAVEVVAPGVIGAGEAAPARSAIVIDQRRAAMAAGVHEGLDPCRPCCGSPGSACRTRRSGDNRPAWPHRATGRRRRERDRKSRAFSAANTAGSVYSAASTSTKLSASSGRPSLASAIRRWARSTMVWRLASRMPLPSSLAVISVMMPTTVFVAHGFMRSWFQHRLSPIGRR